MPENNPLLDVLTHEGVLVNVHIRFWRAEKKLTAADLGLDPENITDRLISLGHKKLLPKEDLAAFSLIESRAHALVERYTFPFLGGLGHFLPNKKLADVTRRLRLLELEFQTAKARFLGKYDQLRNAALRDWQEAAGKLVNDPAQIVAGIESAFPHPTRMEKYFEFTTHLFQIAIPAKMEAKLTSAADQQQIMEARSQAVQQAQTKIAQGVDGFVRDCVATLREQTAQLCRDMLGSMQDSKTGVHQKTLNRLVEFINRFKSLNFAGAAQLESQLEIVRRELLSQTAGVYRDDKTAQVRLKAGIQTLADEARRLAHADASEIVARFGEMGKRKFNLAA